MIIALVFAHVWSVVQMCILGSVGRTIRMRTVLAALTVGLYACAPLAVLVQVAWTRTAASLMGLPLPGVVRIASYTIDPFLEEIIKVLPLAALLMIPVIRRQWSLTDCVLVGAASGAGFGLAEELYRYSMSAAGAHAIASGWVLAIGKNVVPWVPSVPTSLTSWLPDGIWFVGEGTRLNAHLVWSSIAGLAVGLFVLNKKTAARVAAVALLLYVGLDHAAVNAPDIEQTWLAFLARPLRGIDRGLAVMPIAALAAAWWLDRHRAPGIRLTWPLAWKSRVTFDQIRNAVRRPQVILWLLLMTPSVLWFVVGGWPVTARIQVLMIGPIIGKLVAALSVGAQGWVAWSVIVNARNLPRALSLPRGDDAAIMSLGIACGLGSVGLGGFALFQMLNGAPPGTSLLFNAHAADAANQMGADEGAMVADSAEAFAPPSQSDGEVAPADSADTVDASGQDTSSQEQASTSSLFPETLPDSATDLDAIKAANDAAAAQDRALEAEADRIEAHQRQQQANDASYAADTAEDIRDPFTPDGAKSPAEAAMENAKQAKQEVQAADEAAAQARAEADAAAATAREAEYAADHPAEAKAAADAATAHDRALEEEADALEARQRRQQANDASYRADAADDLRDPFAPAGSKSAAEVAAENAKRAAQEVHSADEAAAHARADADAAASAARTARNAAEQADAAQVVTDAANHAAAGDYRFKPDKS
jgi:RsiW-degrading membrane proteinase PrsW (M82 family)